MGISRFATAHWEGDFKQGGGRLDTPESGLMEAVPYGFNTRFGDRKGTNPEELIAAAHAGCFTMAPSLSAIRLKTTARVPGMDAATFRGIADEVGSHCPVSRALSAVPITVEAELATG